MNMSLRQKMLVVFLCLTCLVIIGTSGVYYWLVRKDIRQLSRRQITSAFEMLFDEFGSRSEHAFTRIEEFIEESLVKPLNFMYRSQRFYTDERFGEIRETWDEEDVQTWIYISGYLSRLKTVGSHLHALTPDLNIRQFVVYDKNGVALMVYRQFAEQEILGVYIARLREGTFIPLLNREDIRASKTWKSARDIPHVPLPDGIPRTFADEIPEIFQAEMSRVAEHATLKFTAPILHNDELQGICVVHADILQNETERYSRFSGTEINVFAENAFSVGVLPEYAGVNVSPSATGHQLDLLRLDSLPPLEFTRINVNSEAYSQGRLVLHDSEANTTVMTANIARQRENEKFKELFTLVAVVAFILLLFTTGVSIFLSYWISRPITTITALLTRMIDGNFSHIRQPDAVFTTRAASKHSDKPIRDEIQMLSSSFYAMVTYLREMAEIAGKISQGQISQAVTPRSERDELGNAFADMVSYLHHVAEMADAMAGGDLTVEIALQSKQDVFGQNIQSMTGGLRSLIQQIHNSAEQIAFVGDTIATLTKQDMQVVQQAQTSASEMVSTMTQMQASVNDVAQNMETLTSSVGITSMSMLEMTEEMNGISLNTRELAEQTELLIADLDQVVEHLQTVNAQTDTSRQLSQETIQDAQEGQQAVEQVYKSMDVIHQTNLDAADTITRLANRSQEIGTILDVIYAVNEQSSLLALNASIIAAQAGEHGRGFSVIAEEMRNMADEINASAKNISAIVRMLQEDIHTVVEKIHESAIKVEQGVTRTQEAQTCLQKILSSAQRSSGVVENIATALDIQCTTSETVKTIMEQVWGMTSDVTNAADTQRLATLQMQSAIEQISDLARQTHYATKQQLEGVTLVLNAADTVKILNDRNLESSARINQATSAELNNEAERLLQAVDRFRL